jgi:hypothetical protein
VETLQRQLNALWRRAVPVSSLEQMEHYKQVPRFIESNTTAAISDSDEFVVIESNKKL